MFSFLFVLGFTNKGFNRTGYLSKECGVRLGKQNSAGNCQGEVGEISGNGFVFWVDPATNIIGSR
jgi:hypothetical protein